MNSMRALSAISSFEPSFLCFGAPSLERGQGYFSRGRFFCHSKSAPSPLLAAEKEEAKAVLTLFLKEKGLKNALVMRTVNKSSIFIDHLVCKLHAVHKSRYLVGRELTTLEIRDALIPYLESLREEHGDVLADVVENFPDSPAKGGSMEAVAMADSTLSSKQEKALARISEIGPTGKHQENVLYLIELGLELEQIKGITRRFPTFAYYSLEGKIRPVVEFLLDLGVLKSDIPGILFKRPQLCGMSLTENLIPTMAFLENLGVDKNQWEKVICRFPGFLTYSRQKVNTTVSFLREIGLSAESIGKVLTRCPNIISYSVDDNLRPTSEYFDSLGIDVATLMCKSPQAFGLSVEANLKPVTQFFFDRGYTVEEVRTILGRYGALYTFSLAENLIPKWEYFLTTDYPKSELVKFPQYFGYSLQDRIKPRYELVKDCGVKLLLNQVLSYSDSEFDKALNRKLKKLLASKNQV